VHERERHAFVGELERGVDQGLLVGHRQQDQVVGSLEPLRRDGGVLQGKLEGGVSGLRGLEAGRDVGTAQDVELLVRLDVGGGTGG
jgi:hypothetical protein